MNLVLSHGIEEIRAYLNIYWICMQEHGLALTSFWILAILHVPVGNQRKSCT